MIITIWQCLAPAHEERCTQQKPYHLPSPNARYRQNSYFCGQLNEFIRCNENGCLNQVEYDIYPAKNYKQIEKASREGWFFSKDQSVMYCFDHLPVTVIARRDRTNPEWRKKLRKGLAGKLPSVDEAERVARASQPRYTGSRRSSDPRRRR